MSYQYIALLRGGNPPVDAHADAELQRIGFRHHVLSDAVDLFLSPDTPSLNLPGGGLVIGHAYGRDGTPLNNTALVDQPGESYTSGRLLADYWGDYLLMTPESDNRSGISIMREPSGGVPCVYSVRRGAGFVTSDISLAIRLGLYAKRIDWDYIGQCLIYPHQSTARTGLSGIWTLLPGCSLHVLAEHVFTRTEWTPWDFVVPKARHRDFSEAATQVRSAVKNVVTALGETDQSILLELSGGLDSSIVAASLKDVHAHVSCCTLLPPVPGADERRYAGLMAQLLGVELSTEELGFEQACFNFAIPEHSTTPRMGPLQYAIDSVMKAAGDRLGVTSHFLGAGGDTVFCYLTTAAPAVDAFKERGLAAGAEAVRNLSELHHCTLWKAGHLCAKKALRSPKSPCKMETLFLRSTAAGVVDAPEHPWFNAPEDSLPGDRERVFELAGNQVFRESLPRGEKRRLRMPLLSQPVLEACLRAPSWMWISGGRNRAVARKAFADILPADVLNRRSKGTFMNYLGAVYQRNKFKMQQFLVEGGLHEHGLLDGAAIKHFVEGELAARDQSFTRIFDLCRIENWVRHVN